MSGCRGLNFGEIMCTVSGMAKYSIFISSVQKELQAERIAVRDYIAGDALLRRYFETFLFEDLPATDRRADELYIEEVGRADVYVAILGDEYGREDTHGMSPTEREFNRATERGITRLVFVKGSDDGARHPKMRALVERASDQLVRRRFADITGLKAALYPSLVDFLETRGDLQTRPFEERPCPGANLDDIAPDTVADFVRRARAERQFPLPEETPVKGVLTHLGLLPEGHVSNAAILLFGREPHRFIPCAEIRCMHFHGIEIERPAPFYRIFKGNLFDQVDHGTDFVLSVTRQGIGTRNESPKAPAPHEIPRDILQEAVVNAIVHRDYTSSAAVQVSVFADRVEVWNPGHLILPLTPESLRKPHRSILRNPRMAEVLFLARYIEKYGTGTLMMIRESLSHDLPEPGFQQQAEEFAVTVWRDWLTDEVMLGMGLNERQRQAVRRVKAEGRIGNSEYQELTGVAKRTAHRDLADLVTRGVFAKVGTRGVGTTYEIRTNRATNGPRGHEGTGLRESDSIGP